MLCFGIAGLKDFKYGHVEHGRDGHGRGEHKDKYKYTDNDKYKVLQEPKVCYIYEEQGVLGEDVRMVDMNMADMEEMDMMDMDMLDMDMDMVDMDMVDMDMDTF